MQKIIQENKVYVAAGALIASLGLLGYGYYSFSQKVDEEKQSVISILVTFKENVIFESLQLISGKKNSTVQLPEILQITLEDQKSEYKADQFSKFIEEQYGKDTQIEFILAQINEIYQNSLQLKFYDQIQLQLDSTVLKQFFDKLENENIIKAFVQYFIDICQEQVDFMKKIKGKQQKEQEQILNESGIQDSFKFEHRSEFVIKNIQKDLNKNMNLTPYDKIIIYDQILNLIYSQSQKDKQFMSKFVSAQSKFFHLNDIINKIPDQVSEKLIKKSLSLYAPKLCYGYRQVQKQALIEMLQDFKEQIVLQSLVFSKIKTENDDHIKNQLSFNQEQFNLANEQLQLQLTRQFAQSIAQTREQTFSIYGYDYMDINNAILNDFSEDQEITSINKQIEEQNYKVTLGLQLNVQELTEQQNEIFTPKLIQDILIYNQKHQTLNIRETMLQKMPGQLNKDQLLDILKQNCNFNTQVTNIKNQLYDKIGQVFEYEVWQRARFHYAKNNYNEYMDFMKKINAVFQDLIRLMKINALQVTPEQIINEYDQILKH